MSINYLDLTQYDWDFSEEQTVNFIDGNNKIVLEVELKDLEQIIQEDVFYTWGVEEGYIKIDPTLAGHLLQSHRENWETTINISLKTVFIIRSIVDSLLNAETMDWDKLGYFEDYLDNNKWNNEIGFKLLEDLDKAIDKAK